MLADKSCARWRLLAQVGLFLVASAVTLTLSDSAESAPRPWPNTTDGIHVFNDQIVPNISQAQVEFSATHYAGSQKMPRSLVDRFHAISPNFLTLHYRLGMGLGYRETNPFNCNFSSTPIYLLEGDDWVEEFPADPNQEWFYEVDSSPAYHCTWGWYLMDLDSQSWRDYWNGEVTRQVAANDSDGVFMDSQSLPNYQGPSGTFSPDVPFDYSQPETRAFEELWRGKVERWLTWLQTQSAGDAYLIPNVGNWTVGSVNNPRDTTDFALADGVMVEGFAVRGNDSPYPVEDWRLQANRVLGLVNQGKAVIGQTVARASARDRGLAVGTYLLLKGDRTFINIETDSLRPEWWPEYEIPIGAPTESARPDIGSLSSDGGTIYVRRFSNGLVIVNPTGSSSPQIALDRPRYLASGNGGGDIDSAGRPSGQLAYQQVDTVTLQPYSAAILVDSLDGPCQSCVPPADPGGGGGPTPPGGNPPADSAAGAGRSGSGPDAGNACVSFIKLISPKRLLRQLLKRGQVKARIHSTCREQARPMALKLTAGGLDATVPLRPVTLRAGSQAVLLKTRKRLSRTVARHARRIKLVVN